MYLIKLDPIRSTVLVSLCKYSYRHKLLPTCINILNSQSLVEIIVTI